MNSDTEINKDIQADYEVSEDTPPNFSMGQNAAQDIIISDDLNEHIPLHDKQVQDIEFYDNTAQHRACSNDIGYHLIPDHSPQHSCTFNPDQVVTALLPGLDMTPPDIGTVNTCLVSDNTFTERALETETSLPLPVSQPAFLDHPGFQGLDQVDQPSPESVATTDHRWINSHLPTVMVSFSPSSSAWYTPPQTPTNDSPAIAAMDIPFSLPSGSLYIIGCIQDQPSPMLIDTGASITAVSGSFFCHPLICSFSATFFFTFHRHSQWRGSSCPGQSYPDIGP